MSKHGIRAGALRISGTGMPGEVIVELDGQHISKALTGLNLRMRADERPTLLLDLSIHYLDTAVTVDVRLPDATRALLVQLGWTPPAEEAG